ncbi:uncharacterized protein LOC136097014 [Hydra vulgaris]|uniref:uncharacterized protein LOC136097014 n=1 Tax=Hydra vulgaris TaxID=6087 RepID=UPI0032EA0D57
MATTRVYSNNTGVECAIRTRVVDVNLTPGFLVYPAAIEVKECSGKNFRLPFKKCIPTELENTIHTVWDINYDTNSTKARNISIEEPKGCKLGCIIDSSYCSPAHVFDKESCVCTCSSNVQKCTVDKQWSAISCACECSNTESPECRVSEKPSPISRKCS